MNILTVPLIAVALFLSWLIYSQLQQDAQPNATQLPTTSDSDLRIISPEIEQQAGYTPHGKPAAAVALQSSALQTIAPQQRKKLTLVLQSHLEDGTVDIKLDSDNGLRLVSKTQHWSLPVSGKSLIQLPVELVADSDGVHHLHLLVQHLSAEGEATSRALAVQFHAGMDDGAKLFSKSTNEGSYPALIPLEVEEEIF